MTSKINHFAIFCISMFSAFFFWRLLVILKAGEISILRNITGLNIHHYHYGIILVFIASLFFIFNKPKKLSIALAGIGFGTYFDGFISRLTPSISRAQEVSNYNFALLPTFLLLIFLSIFAFLFYIFNRNKS